MAVSTASNVAPILSRDKGQSQLKPIHKKPNPLIFIGVGVMILLAASGVWRTYHDAQTKQSIQVLAAGRDMPAGVRLGYTTIRYMEVPKPYVTADMLTSLTSVSGRITKTFIPAGEPIRDFMLLPGHNNLSLSLETHERAITLELSDDAMVDHSILPDDRVDVLVISPDKNGNKYTKTLCQSVRVLIAAPKEQMLARHMSSSTHNNKITLAVTPDSAEAITEAMEVGKIRLVLRNRLSISEPHLAGVAPADLLPADATATQQSSGSPTISLPPMSPPPVMLPLPIAKEPSTPLEWMVEVISGSHKESYGVPIQ